MTTILIKKKDTAGAPAPGDLTNAAGGTEIAVNTATKRIYTKDSGGNVVELGTNSTSSTIDQLTVVTSTTLSYGTANQVQYLNASKLLVGSSNLTFNGTTLTANTIGAFTLSGTIAGGGNQINNVIIGSSTPLAGAFTTLTASSTLTVTGAGSIEGLTVGRGAGAVATNTAVGASALAANTTGLQNTALGWTAGQAFTTGAYSTAVGSRALQATTTGSNNTSVGAESLFSNTTGAQNTAVGYQAGYTLSAVANQTFIGYQAGYSRSTGADNYSTIMVGNLAGYSTSTGIDNTYIGGYAARYQTGSTNTALGGGAFYGASGGSTGSNNTAVGYTALFSNTTASSNTALGYQAAYANTTGAVDAFGYQALSGNATGLYNAAFGFQSLANNTTGTYNAGFGRASLYLNTTGGYNSAHGVTALQNNTTGSNNTAQGAQALYNNTTASNNTAVGYQAGYSNTTAASNTIVGYQAGYSTTTGAHNVLIGQQAGYALTTGFNNTFIGTANGAEFTCGGRITTGSKNTIIGGYSGNQGGLDIRTASNYIVLSDGDGVPHAYNGANDWYLAPNYRSFLTRGNNGGGSSTQTSGNFFKIGTWHVSNQGARATLRISGAVGFGAGSVCAGETVISLVYANNNDVEGFYYSVVGSGTTGVNAVAVKNTAGAVEVWVKTQTFASTAVFPDCVLSRWEGANTDTGSTGTPAGATLLSNYFRYIDSSASDTAVTLNQYGVGVGGAVPSSGRGITFPATQSASSNANTLDDYEEGTWTPTFSTTATNYSTLTYSAQLGHYTKIGNMVTFWGWLETTTVAGGTGNVQINGLPFTTAFQATLSNNWSNGAWSTQVPISGHILSGSTSVYLTYFSATQTVQVPSANLINGSQIIFSGYYRVG